MDGVGARSPRRRAGSERTSAGVAGLVGWRPAALGAEYDVVVAGSSPLALAIALRVASTTGRSVGVLQPAVVGEGWPPRARAWLHTSGRTPELAELVRRSVHRYRLWAADGVLSARWRSGGHLQLASTLEELRALASGVGNGAVSAWSPRLDRAALVAAAPLVDADAVLGGRIEPSAAVAELDGLPWQLATAAAAHGVDLVEDAAVLSLHRGGRGWEVQTAAGTTTAERVIDATDTLALAGAVGVPGIVVAATDRRLVTEAVQPALGPTVGVGTVRVGQTEGGEFVIEAPDPPVSAGWSRSPLLSFAEPIDTVISVLPALGLVRALRGERVRHAVAIDGVPLVGEVAEALWCVGGFGAATLDVLPVVADLVASELRTGRVDAALRPLAPRRLAVATDLPAADVLEVVA